MSQLDVTVEGALLGGRVRTEGALMVLDLQVDAIVVLTEAIPPVATKTQFKSEIL